jgi:hypothetical protein
MCECPGKLHGGNAPRPRIGLKEMKMKVKPDLEVSSADFWYDLTEGGCLEAREAGDRG